MLKLNDYWFEIKELPKEKTHIGNVEIISYKKDYITLCEIVQVPNVQTFGLKVGDKVYCRRKFHIIEDKTFVQEDDIWIKVE